MEIALATGKFSAGVFDSNETFRGQTSTPERTVSCLELEFYSEDGGVTYLGDVACPIRAGYMLRALPNETRHSKLPLKTDYLKTEDDGGVAAEAICALPRYSRIPDGVDPAKAIREILAAANAGDELLAGARFLQFLSQLRAGMKRASQLDRYTEERRRSGISRAIDFMETHYMESVSLGDIAASANFTPIYFHGLFRRAIGKTPFEYLSDVRMEEAKRILITEPVSIGEVAERCGFCSQSYFNTVFHRMFGITPGAYRRQELERYLKEDGK